MRSLGQRRCGVALPFPAHCQYCTVHTPFHVGEVESRTERNISDIPDLEELQIQLTIDRDINHTTDDIMNFETRVYVGTAS
jgi:hypothetical protein